MAKTSTHRWAFKPRFRRNAFGWRSQPAITRVRQAVAEIKKVAKNDPVLAGEGAVTFLERLSPALERIDSSSGAIGSAVNNAIEQLVPIIASAPADGKTRAGWLERLLAALEADEIPYIESLGEHWGELCASKEVASAQADALIGTTRLALSPDEGTRGFFWGSSACLSALYSAERYEELIEISQGARIWPYKRWAAKALLAQGRKADALRYAEACSDDWNARGEIARLCEEILLSSGMADEAYARYGLAANRGGTYLARFRALVGRYPHKSAGEILADLVKSTPGEEGKWFAAAKSAGLYEEALALASRAPCDPRTLTRAARDFADDEPAFAVGCGLLALHWLVQGYGYEVTRADVRAAFESTLTPARKLGIREDIEDRIRKTLAAQGAGRRFVLDALRGELGPGSP